ncbi:MAG TPA: hypothetical protein VLU47_08235 [Blastocatellia bacterium]|nr:hypothetical protein [Blastocatellia bacterium]
MTEKHHSQSERGAETSTLNIGPVVWFLVSLAAGAAITFVLMGGMFNLFESRIESEEGKPSPLAAERERIAPEPRVQLAPSTIEQVEGRESPNLKTDHPLVEMERVQKEESEKLNNYSWIDEKNGIVRLPINEAKKLLLERGLPTRIKPVEVLPASGQAPPANKDSSGSAQQGQR